MQAQSKGNIMEDIAEVNEREAVTNVAGPATPISLAPNFEVLPVKSGVGMPAVGFPTADDPAYEGGMVAHEWRSAVVMQYRSAEMLIRACVRIKDALRSFGDDDDRLDVFLAALVEGGVLTQAEAESGSASPKLVKLRKIGERGDLLLDDRVLPFLTPGYSTAYQTTVLCNHLPKADREETIDKLLSTFKAMGPAVTRKGLIGATRDAKVKPLADKKVDEKRSNMPPRPTMGDVIAAGERFNLLAMTLHGEDLRLFTADFPNPDALAEEMPLADLLEQDAAVVVFARIIDLPVIAEKVPLITGVRRISRVILLRQPASSDVTEAQVVVIAERGDVTCALPQNCEFLAATDTSAILAELFPQWTKTLHVFAREQTAGSICLVGDDSWNKETSK
jgi:hypothetical protein